MNADRNSEKWRRKVWKTEAGRREISKTELRIIGERIRIRIRRIAVSTAMTAVLLSEILLYNCQAAGTIDFTALQNENPDICAWLEIPDMNLSYPVLQNPDDDTFYLDHDENGSTSASGALFTEAAYNDTDFDDPVTVIYGHHMHDGSMFGNLQSWFSDQNHLTEEAEITLYTPEGSYSYQVFAAVPFDKWHILYNCDFSKPSTFGTFFRQINQIREIGAVFDDSIEVRPGDHILILSTCLQGNRNRRFLVCAVRDEDLMENDKGSED